MLGSTGEFSWEATGKIQLYQEAVLVTQGTAWQRVSWCGVFEHCLPGCAVG